jgi:predicted outer membrane repeat protein
MSRGSIFAAALLGLIGVLTAADAQAQTITVNDASDPGSGSTCTLRGAMILANGGSIDIGTCVKTGGGPLTINFNIPGTGPFTIALIAQLPAAANSMTITINGGTTPATGITIDGGLGFRVMSVNPGATLNIAYLTIANGNPMDLGGGILNHGKLNATNVTFSNNAGEGGGIYNDGTATVTNCFFSGNQSGNGAAINTEFGTLIATNTTFANNSASSGDGGAVEGNGTYTNCTFSNNNATVGGAIFGSGTFTNCTFSGNHSEAEGGAILGGGTVTNCTFSGNSGDEGGGIFAVGSLAVTNSTFSGNSASQGGGIANTGSTNTLKGTILASSGGGDCFAFNPTSYPITDGGYNIADDTSCDFTTTTSQVITPTSAIGLASGLAQNGGPTETIALNGTPANTFIPAAECTDQSGNPLTTDQRGFARPVKGTCSAGAYQYASVPIDCSPAVASNPNLTAVLPVFASEYVFGVNNQARPYNLQITGVTQDKPVPGFPLCPNAFWSSTTTYVRVTNEPLQPGPTGLQYLIHFTATDTGTGASCNGAVPVCVQGILNSGQPCVPPPAPGAIIATLAFDATKCP